MTRKLTTEEFINRAQKVHGDKYDYSLVKYYNSRSKIKIICLKHTIFEQTPDNHLHGEGCQICGGTKKSNTNNFISKAKLIHGDKYDYSLVKYVNKRSKVKIICPKHGIFEQRAEGHIVSNGRGCPICKESKGEKQIRLFLKENNINFVQQHKFKDCVDIKPLPFDFYLPDYKICVEYDGIQHSKPIEFFGGLKCFETIKIRDKIKTDYCHKNNIKLIRIKGFYFNCMKLFKTALLVDSSQ